MRMGHDLPERRMPLRVGLTGGIAAGKSTAARMFAVRGVPVLDLDAVGRRLLDEDETVQRAVAAAFPEALHRDAIVRTRLAEAAFADPARLKRLEGILHPRIWRACEQWIANQQAPYVLIEAPALLESGGQAHVDRIVAVLAPEHLRRARARRRGGATAKLFSRILAMQVSDEERLRAADHVLMNNGDLAALEAQVQRVHAALLAEARAMRHEGITSRGSASVVSPDESELT